MTREEFFEKGRFGKAPNKETLMTKFIIDGSDLGIKNIGDDFEVTERFNMKMEFSKLNYT